MMHAFFDFRGSFDFVSQLTHGSGERRDLYSASLPVQILGSGANRDKRSLIMFCIARYDRLLGSPRVYARTKALGNTTTTKSRQAILLSDTATPSVAC